MSYTLHNPLNSVPPVGSSGMEEKATYFRPASQEFNLNSSFFSLSCLDQCARVCLGGIVRREEGGSSSFLTKKQQSVPPLIPTGRTANRFPKRIFKYFFVNTDENTYVLFDIF